MFERRGLRLATVALVLAAVACAQYVEQRKLVGSGAPGTFQDQGVSVALSADGNTALIGGTGDGAVGGVWVFVRSNGAWVQQGDKLIGLGSPFPAYPRQGQSVALSADGNTALVGGPGDNFNHGAAWVFTRSGGVWTQQGSKLVGSGTASPVAWEGQAVALSADGNTALIGGPVDNNEVGAAWIFTRSGGVWTQQGDKLVGSGWIGIPSQGWAVALSADGNTALVGGPQDNNGTGAVWAFTRTAGVWTQQGSKITGTGEILNGELGKSVALSADGNTAFAGAPGDNNNIGAIWAFTRNGGVWSQQGDKIVPLVQMGGLRQGGSVALSADGNRAIVGAPWYRTQIQVGAAFALTRTAGGWRSSAPLVAGDATPDQAELGSSVAISAGGSTALAGAPLYIGGGATLVFYIPHSRDFNADARSDALLYDPAAGAAYTALTNGDGTFQYVYNLFTPGFDTLRTGDFNGDGKADLILYNSHGGPSYLGLGSGDGTFAFQSLFWSPGYDVVEVGPLHGGGISDVVLYNSSTGALYSAGSNGDGTFTYQKQASAAGLPGPGFTLARTGYFFNPYTLDLHLPNNGRNEAVLYNGASGLLYLALIDQTYSSDAFQLYPVGVVPGDAHVSPGYDRLDIGDVNGDGFADIILYNSANGSAAVGISAVASSPFTPPAFSFTPFLVSPGFTAVRLADFTGDGNADLILYNKNTGIGYFGRGDGAGNFAFQSLFWSPGYDFVEAEDVNGDTKTDVVLYNSATGTSYTGISDGAGGFQYRYSYWGISKLLSK